MKRSFAIPVLLVGGALLAGCGDDTTETTTGTPGPTPVDFDAALAIGCDDDADAIYGDVAPPSDWSADQRGTIVACRKDRAVSKDEMSQHFGDHGFEDPGITTGVRKWNILYWTERKEGEPVLTSASVYLPDEPRDNPPPVVVAGHGSVGIADKCAPSKEDAAGFHDDWRAQVYGFAGDGYVVVQPDFPGIGTAGTGSWMSSLDEGHAMLDATRAVRKLFADGTLAPKNVLVGHSNGGHAALSAQAFAKDYGSDGSIDATIVYAPFWLSNGAWGALLSPLGSALDSPTFVSITMQYFYGHLGAFEGEEHATDAFKPELAEAARDLLEGSCWLEVTSEEKGPPSVGIPNYKAVFTTEYVDAVGPCGASDTCEGELAETWRARWVEDRPAVDPDIPIVLWQGAKDDFVTPGFQRCGIDRLEGQNADLKVCVGKDDDHSSIVAGGMPWARSYLRHVLYGEAEPEACLGDDALDAPKCGAPLPNSTDPADP